MKALSLEKRLKDAEEACMGAAFLLKKLQYAYSADFGTGTSEQVRDCIRDCQKVALAAANAKAKA